MTTSRIQQFLRTLGPGLLYAAAAIGVSHLVQSTRAGAEYGFALVGVVILANFLKFPFFEYGPRYAAATGKSLLDGYKGLGNWAVAVFLIMTMGTIFIIQAAVTVVTAGLAGHLTGINLPPWQWSGIILLTCLAVLLIGHYHFLDRLIKVIMIVLTLTTLVALVAAIFGTVEKDTSLMQGFDWSRQTDIFFLIALAGWMPAPLDISVWHSVWTQTKNRDEHGARTLRDSLRDFRIGFWGTAFLAVCFLSLGALVLYGTGESMPSSGVAFAGRLIDLYTESLGSWTYPVISIAAFTTMFSTTLTVLDAYPRVLGPTTKMLIPELAEKVKGRGLYWFWILFTAFGTMVILTFYLKSMTDMVDVATTISFVLAPVFAIMNFRVIMGKDVPESSRPGKRTRLISWIGIIFLCGFTVYYLVLSGR